MNKEIFRVTSNIIKRSKKSRQEYLDRMNRAVRNRPNRSSLSSSNLVDSIASLNSAGKKILGSDERPNIAIISAYSEVVSAHQPLNNYVDLIKRTAVKAGGYAQYAGGVPALSSGVVNGEPGMELSMMSRDLIAMSTALALSHNTFDAVAFLGVSDMVVSGMLMGSLSFGHLPAIFIPAGPMSTGMNYPEYEDVNKRYLKGEATSAEVFAADTSIFHSVGSHNSFGPTNTSQLLMEFMGLHLPGMSFINPETPLRNALTEEATRRLLKNTHLAGVRKSLAGTLDEKTMVNAMVGLAASGGSSNHTIHLVAIARAAGIIINWDDLHAIAEIVPVLANIYPNGEADINHFDLAGGIQFMIYELSQAGFLHDDVETVNGRGISRYCFEPFMTNGQIKWRNGVEESVDLSVLRPVNNPFKKSGAFKLFTGNLGRAILRCTIDECDSYVVEAPAKVFASEEKVLQAYRANELRMDLVLVLIYQGPKANGMPALTKLGSILEILRDKGYKIAVITDGRISGPLYMVPAAVHTCPEAIDGGLLAKIRDGDIIRVDPHAGTFDLQVHENELNLRQNTLLDSSHESKGFGRELFHGLRRNSGQSEHGASSIFSAEDASNSEIRAIN